MSDKELLVELFKNLPDESKNLVYEQTVTRISESESSDLVDFITELSNDSCESCQIGGDSE